MTRRLAEVLFFVGLTWSQLLSGAVRADSICRQELSAAAYEASPVSPARIDAALSSPEGGQLLHALSETLAWLREQPAKAFSMIAIRLRTPALVDDCELDFVAACESESSADWTALLRGLGSSFTSEPSEPVMQILSSLLGTYTTPPALPRDKVAMRVVLERRIEQSVDRFISEQFEAHQGLLINMAVTHWERLAGRPATNRLGKQILLDRVRRDYAPADFGSRLKSFCLYILDRMFFDWDFYVRSGKLDPAIAMDRHVEEFGRGRLHGEGAHLALVRRLIQSALMGDPDFRRPELKVQLVAAAHREILRIVTAVESRRVGNHPQTGSQIEIGVNTKPRGPSTPRASVSHRRAKRERAEALSPDAQDFETDNDAVLPEPGELSDAARRTLKEFNARYLRTMNIKSVDAIVVLTALLGEPRRAGSHSIFPCPFGSRPTYVVERHGSELSPSAVYELRDLVKTMSLVYSIR